MYVLESEITSRANAPNTTAELESAVDDCAQSEWGIRSKRSEHSVAYERSAEIESSLTNALSI
jgi:hypothetical protein